MCVCVCVCMYALDVCNYTDSKSYTFYRQVLKYNDAIQVNRD